MISADQATLLLIGTVETLGCLPPHSNEKPWPRLVSKVTKAYCNCTFSNGVSHARTPTPVMTITIMSLGSTGAFRPSVTLGEGMLVNCCWRFKGFNTALWAELYFLWVIMVSLHYLSIACSFYFILFYFFQVRDLPQCEKTLLGHVQTGFVFELKPEFLNVSAQKLKLFWLSMQNSH